MIDELLSGRQRKPAVAASIVARLIKRQANRMLRRDIAFGGIAHNTNCQRARNQLQLARNFGSFCKEETNRSISLKGHWLFGLCQLQAFYNPQGRDSALSLER